MAISNHERVGKALDALKAGLRPFVERELEARYKDQWKQVVAQVLVNAKEWQAREAEPTLDVQALLILMWDQWNAVFYAVLGHAERSLVSELRGWRNKWAHQEPFSTDDAYRVLDSAGRLLAAISAPQAAEVETLKSELLRLRFEEQTRHQTRKTTSNPIEGQPSANLRPWREIITPHPDVASGRFRQAEFAADLSQVQRGEGGPEYLDPREFFSRTYITEGLRHLLVNALRRLAGDSGDPVVELKTNFGGGKTHSMLALYHLFGGMDGRESGRASTRDATTTGGTDVGRASMRDTSTTGGLAASLPGVEALLQEAGVASVPKTRRAVIVGQALSPAQPRTKPDGTEVRTLWGELAWQLLGAEGYAMVAEADRLGVSPGSEILARLFRQAAPSLILIDEWVTYLRQIYHAPNLPAGSFEANLTFAQALTEAAKAAPETLLVASLPSSVIEIGGEGGQEALTRLSHTFGRVESTWRPASTEEGFEIVRRRLFQPMEANLYPLRDAVIRAFSEQYRAGQGQFPAGCREAEYERRMRTAYPIHPELFARLYEDWSSLDRFQRTRGVLRLMAVTIHALWERQDAGLLILPAGIPIDEDAVQFELQQYLEDPWIPVIETDVDGPASLPLRIDRQNANLGRYSAARRVARTIFMGSAPKTHTANKGIDDRHINLGSVQPGENVATFGDALRRLTDGATHLYADGTRFWYSTQPSVARLADDRAAQLDEDTVLAEIEKSLRESSTQRGDFARVQPCPNASADVPDERESRLVILRPGFAHVNRASDSPARSEAERILASRGNAPRIYANTLVFLAADKARLDELQRAVRLSLAWASIVAECTTLNLDPFQESQARTKAEAAARTVKQRIPETYIWVLIPGQPEPGGPIEWQELKAPGDDPLAVRASRKLVHDDLLVPRLAGTVLRHHLDRIPLWRGERVGVRQLWEDFCKYLYLPRLASERVLLDAIAEGAGQMLWESDAFAYASDWDESSGRYLGLTTLQRPNVIADGHSLVVQSPAARRQLDAQEKADTAIREPAPDRSLDGPLSPLNPHPSPLTPQTPLPKPRRIRYYGSVELDPLRLTRDAGRIADELVQHLESVTGSTVTIRLEIEADLPPGVDDSVIRTVTENGKTLHVEPQGFEEVDELLHM